MVMGSFYAGLVLAFGLWAMMWAVTIGIEEDYWWRMYRGVLVTFGGTDD